MRTTIAVLFIATTGCGAIRAEVAEWHKQSDERDERQQKQAEERAERLHTNPGETK